MIVIVVTGGRNFNDQRFIWNELDIIRSQHNIDVLRHGNAAGVDQICGQWAVARGIPVEVMPADWNNIQVPGAVVKTNRYGKPYNAVAGHLRNQAMIYGATMAVAFPGGAGTADMVRRITAAGLPLYNSAARYV